MPSTEMREPTFLLLAALAGQPRHGYALMQEIEKLSGGRVRLKPGSLYGALDRLVGEGLIGVHGEDVVDGRLRRYYALTPDGEDGLRRETRRLRANVSAATAGLRTRSSRLRTGEATS